MGSESNNVNEGKVFEFDLNMEPVDETLDLNVPNDEENHNSPNLVDQVNRDSPNPVNEENRDSPNDPDSCSVCREPLVNTSGDQKTLVTLKCAHKFHLDCLGSAYNAKGFMECPNCRNVEPGQWRFENGEFHVVEMIDEEQQQEEVDNDPRYFEDVVIRSEFCPFGNFGHQYPFEGLQCTYAECSFNVAQYLLNLQFSESSDSSSEANTDDTEEVPDPNDLPRSPPPSPRFNIRSPYPLLPHIILRADRRIFWSSTAPGVMRGRIYLCHPYFNHSPLGRSNTSMLNAPMASSYPSSSTMQFNSAPSSSGHMVLNFLEPPTRETPETWVTPNGSIQVCDPFNVVETTDAFLVPLQQSMIENEFYNMIYGYEGGLDDNSGSRNYMGGLRGSRGGRGLNGNNDNGGNGNVGGNGNGNGISG